MRSMAAKNRINGVLVFYVLCIAWKAMKRIIKNMLELIKNLIHFMVDTSRIVY